MRTIEQQTPQSADSSLGDARAPGIDLQALSMASGESHYHSLEETGYPVSFLQSLETAIRSAHEQQGDGALLVLSVENLAMIMSGYGHRVSEDMMHQIGREISEIIGKHDIIRRIQRDQFGIILHSTQADEVNYLSDRILSHIREMSCYSQYGSLHVLCSITSVAFPSKALSANEALDKIFIAMHDDSATREGVQDVFNGEEEQSAHNREEMGLANYLNKAIQENRLKLAYQPIIDAKTGDVSYYEALLRLCSDDGKISSAGALIPIAERMGMIDLIDNTTLNMVAEELRRAPDLTLALNVSNLTTRNPQWLESLTHIIRETPEIAARLIVEITETAAQRDLRRTAFFVAEIQALGAQVALDDFGSGYTSFRQLKTLSVDIVKIDGAFVKDLVDNADNRFFVKTLLDFTNGFGLKSVAEFVETGEIAKMLMELGVEYLQGYYFGRPENHRSWLKDGEYGKE